MNWKKIKEKLKKITILDVFECIAYTIFFYGLVKIAIFIFVSSVITWAMTSVYFTEVNPNPEIVSLIGTMLNNVVRYFYFLIGGYVVYKGLSILNERKVKKKNG